ncbi:MAG: sugar phosphate nucleotidyltransferase [Vicinamibacterales bacterium]
MQALILAGGQGARLRPYTTILPKPMMPVGDYPILEIILRQLKHAGVTDVILAVGYLSQLFQAFFQDGDRYGLRISYSFEDAPLGTAGPLALVVDRLQEDFLVMNGDLLTTLNYGNLFDFHRTHQAAATIGLYRREVKIDFGVIECDASSQLVAYREKPAWQFTVSMGINALNKRAVLPYLTPGAYLDLPELMLRMRADGRPVLCYEEACSWLDVGRLDDYQAATEAFLARKQEFLPPA